MSDYNFAGRSNSVKVKDIEGLQESLKHFGHLWVYPEDDKYYISAENYDAFFQNSYNDETDEEIELDPDIHIIPFLEDGEILIVMEISNCKLRDIYGFAGAWMKGKKRLHIDLDQIHGLIEREWNTDSYNSF